MWDLGVRLALKALGPLLRIFMIQFYKESAGHNRGQPNETDHKIVKRKQRVYRIFTRSGVFIGEGIIQVPP